MPVPLSQYRALAEVRYQLRRFLVFSEARAREVDLEPQQHQLLLALRGLPHGVAPTIGHVAERLQIQHHSAVELVDRSEKRGIVKRRASATDRRAVLLEPTARGLRLLEKLAVTHRTELRSMAPSLVGALEALVAPKRGAS